MSSLVLMEQFSPCCSQYYKVLSILPREIPPTPRATGNTIELSKSLVHPWLSPHKGIDSLEVWQLLIHLGKESRTLALYTHGVQCLINVISFRRTPVVLRQRLIVVKYFSVRAPLFDSSASYFWTVTSQTFLQSLFSPTLSSSSVCVIHWLKGTWRTIWNN